MSEDANVTTAAPDAAAPPAADPGAAVTPEAAPAPAQDAGKAAEAAPDAAAEAFSVAVPEGAEAFAGDFETFSKDMDGWLKSNPQATAREALAEAAARQARVVGEQQQAFAQQRTQQLDAWAGDLRKDTEFGGEKFDANVATAVKGLDAVGTPELRQLLDQSGLGSHPDVVRAFWKVGQMVADTPVVTGKAGTSTRSNFAAALYGNGNGKD